MSRTPVTIKIDTELKNEVQKLAKNMGLSLSAIVENKLREVARDRHVVFKEKLVPNKKFAKQLGKIEKDIKAGRNVSEAFDTVDELFDQLETHDAD